VVVLPSPGDLQIPRALPLLAEAELGKDTEARSIVGHDGGLNPMQTESAKGERHGISDRFGRVPLTLILAIDPVPQVSVHERAPHDSGEGDSTEERLCFLV
jgi:hypothetical protein